MLGTCLRYPGTAARAVTVLGNLWDTAFTAERGQLAEITRTFVRAAKLPDQATVIQSLPDSLELITECVRHYESAEVIENRAEQLATIAKRRLLLRAAQRCQAAGTGAIQVDAAIQSSFSELSGIYSGASQMRSADDVGAEELENYAREAEEPRHLTGVPTGLPLIDKATGGLEYGEYSVLGARTSHGKSALAVSYIGIFAAMHGYPVLVIGHEMSETMYYQRAACALAQCDFNIAKARRLRMKTRERYEQQVDYIRSLPLTFYTELSNSPADLFPHVVSWREKQGKRGLVIIDHLQNEYLPNYRGQRYEMFTEMSGQWKACMKATGCAGLIIAQLNRGASGSEPTPAQLRDSGAIEQDAYAVMLLYRQGADKGQEDKPANVAQVALPKNRNGLLAYDYLRFDGYCMRFTPWQHDDEQLTVEQMHERERIIQHNQDLTQSEQNTAQNSGTDDFV